MPGIAQLGLGLIRTAEAVDGGNGGEQLHGRRGTHHLPLVVTVDDRVGCEVIDHEPYLRGLEHIGLEETVDAMYGRMRPLKRERVAHEGVSRQSLPHFLVLARYVLGLYGNCGQPHQQPT